MPEATRNFVGGEWIASEAGETFETNNPADTDEVVGRFQRSSAEDAAAAVEAAASAQDEWAATPGPKRGAVLRYAAKRLDDLRDELTETLVLEEGKTWSEAAGEVGRAVDIFYYYAEKAREIGGTVKGSTAPNRRIYTVQEPVGVSALITPWNYPVAIPAWKIAPALAAGNAIVFKPATLAPGVSRQLVECIEGAGVPDGVVNYVTGPGSEVGATFATHDDVSAVSFTGSTRVGTTLYAQATEEGKRVQTEMGGKNPTVITDNANLDEAAEIVGTGAFGVTGQACTACSRAIVHESVHDQFVDRVVEYAEGVEVGPGLEDPDMGPQVSESELESTLDYVELGQREGATLETGGEALSGGQYDTGHFVSPAVYSDVDPRDRLAQEEVFGPVLAVIRAADLDEAIALANGVTYGLSASIVTGDHGEALRFLDETEAGVLKVNEKTTGLELHVPFGGFKNSSSETWREQGTAGLDFYTLSKTIYDNY